MSPTMIALLCILAFVSVAALYVWLVYVPYMLDGDLDDEIDYTRFYEKPDLKGDGTTASPYLIETAGDLAELAGKVNQGSSYSNNYFVLMNDIDMTAYLSEGGKGYNDGAGWEMIGSFNKRSYFSGIFDGNGYTISGLTINRPDDDAGLFGYTYGADIYRFNVEAESIIAGNNAGALIGRAVVSQILDCSATVKQIFTTNNEYANGRGILIGYSSGSSVENSSAYGSLSLITDNFTSIGGIVGDMDYGGITNCFSSIELTAEAVGGTINAGGITGYMRGGSVTNCRSEGSITVSGDNTRAGGVAGCIEEVATIEKSSSSCDVAGDGSIGGFVGLSFGNISRSYAEGNVTGKSYTDNGKFVGVQEEGRIENCFSTGNITGGYFEGFAKFQSENGIIINCYAVSENISVRFVAYQNGTVENCYFSAELQNPETFINWDFMNVWYITEGGYPRLR